MGFLSRFKELILISLDVFVLNRSLFSFNLKKLNKFRDKDVIALFLRNLDFYHSIKLLPILPKENEKILVFAPHQDDAAIGLGGFLNLINDCKIKIIYLTNGDSINDINLVDVRDKESSEFCDSIGAVKYNLGISNYSLDIDQNHLDYLSNIDFNNYDQVFFPWILDVPPKHRLFSLIISDYIKKSKFRGKTFQYSVHSEIIPNRFVNISNYSKQKDQAISIYKSQIKLKDYVYLSKALDIWGTRFVQVEDVNRVELLFELNRRELKEVFDKLKFEDRIKLMKGHEKCINAYKKYSKLC